MAKKKSKDFAASSRANTGTYRYDRLTGKVVQISARVPKVASKGKASVPERPCGRRGPCGGGSCPQ
ncbi:MAG: hypothetical protein AAB036_08780 [Elusimicrobiota bacterium]